MANRAVSGGGQLAAALQRGGRPGAGAGRRHRRDLRPPRQGAAGDAQHRTEQPRRTAEPPFAALLFLGRGGLPFGIRPVQRLSQLVRGDRQLAKTNAGGVEHRVGDGRRAGHRRRLPGTQRRIVRARHHHHVHLRHLREGQDRVSPPFFSGDRRFLKGHALFQYPAGRLQNVAVDLVTHAVRVDHHARVVADHDARHRHFAAGFVDRHVGHPGGPGRAKAGKLAVDVTGIGKAAPAQHAIFRRGLHRFGVRRPASAFCGAAHQFTGAFVMDIAQPIFQRIDAGGVGQLIDIRFVGEGVRQGGNAAHPGGAHDRRHVLDADAQRRILIRRHRGAVAHFIGHRQRFDAAGQQQRQRRRAVGRIIGAKVVGDRVPGGVQPAVHLHQLRRALRFPHMLLFAGQLHPHRPARRARQQRRVGADVIGAIAAIATGRLHANDLDLRFRVLQQPGQIGAQQMRILAA